MMMTEAQLLERKGAAMKKILPVELNYCDGCGKQQDYLIGCMSCGVEHCYECRESAGKEYPHSVHCSGIARHGLRSMRPAATAFRACAVPAAAGMAGGLDGWKRPNGPHQR